jgi:hypothetical protein
VGPEIIFPAVIYYGVALAVVGVIVGGIVAGWGSLFIGVAGLAVVAGVLNGVFAPSPHGMFAGVVAFVAVFVVVGIFAALSHLIRRHLDRGKPTAV